MTRLWLLALVACGGAQHPHAQRVVPVAPVATATREAKGPETALSGFTFDPALDCVAQKLGGTIDPARYRNVLPIECGSPLHVVEARLTTAAELQATVADMAKRFIEPVPLALGTAQSGDKITVVIASRGVDLERFKPGDPTIRGTLLINVKTLKALVSTAHGVAIQDVARDGASFSIPAPAGDADIEFAIVSGTETGPLALVRVGKGSPLFAGPGDLLTRTNATRAALHLPTVQGATTVGDCKAIPAKVGDIDVTDRASCYRIVKLGPEYLADEVAYGPVMQAKLLLPDIALLEIGQIDGEAAYRVLRRFEVLTPEQGRARVLARLRERWPTLAERATPRGALAGIMDAWAASGQPDETTTQFHPQLMEVAKHWSRQPHFYAALSTSRDLDKTIDQVAPDDTPTEVDIAFEQVRDSRGQMRNLLVVVLSLP